ncbi:MAG: electron transport complex subunit E [Acholeplasmatales bacterium]|nr:electron transport complex subunit E [Acholeplasmatales bacterium]
MKDTITKKAAFVSGIIKENPVFVSLLGMCPTLATTKSVESAIGMGILVILVLLGSNLLISLLRKIIPSEVKIPCYIVVIATFVTIVKMLTQAFVPALYSSLGVFISLIVVNCIILGRAEAFASKHGPVASILDAIGTGIGYTIALVIVALIRELIGTGALSFGVYFPIGKAYYLHLFPAKYALSIFVQSAGGFLALGLVLAVMACYKNIKDDKKAAAEKARIEELKKKKAEELAKKKAEEDAKKAAEANAQPVEAKAEAVPTEKPAEEAKETPVIKPEVKEAV